MSDPRLDIQTRSDDRTAVKKSTNERLATKAKRLWWWIWFIHSSGRFDRSDASWRRALKRLSGFGIVITGTEAAGRSDGQFAAALTRAGWDWAHLTGPAAGECYASWDATLVELFADPFARKLSDKTWVRAKEFGGKTAAKVHALVVPLRLRVGRRRRKFVVVVTHDPLDNTGPREAAWVDVQKGKAVLKADLEERWPDAEVIFVGDVNKNLREPDESVEVRRCIEHPMNVVASWRRRMPKTDGTHPNPGADQVIDMAFAAKGVIVACELLPDDDSSDHRPFRYRVRGRVRRNLVRAARKLAA